MPDKINKILKYNHRENSLKALFMIYADLECLLEKIYSCQIAHLMLQKISLIVTEAKIVWKSFCKDLREHPIRIVNYLKKEMTPLTDEENKFYEEQEVCNICKKGFTIDNDKKHHKVGDRCHYTGKFREAAHSIYNLRYKTPKEIPIVFHNGSIYDYHFIINKLAKEFHGQLECLGENTEKYITFSVPISKELDNGKTITYKLKFIDSFRFMSTSLSSLVDNLSDNLSI